MCVICNVADKPFEETIYIVSETASGDNFMVPMVVIYLKCTQYKLLSLF